jgi:hypothetical protein
VLFSTVLVMASLTVLSADQACQQSRAGRWEVAVQVVRSCGISRDLRERDRHAWVPDVLELPAPNLICFVPFGR